MVEPSPNATSDGLHVCASQALKERGRGVVWSVLLQGEPTTAFALRIDGKVVSYINRCKHVAAELDWQPGEFLDADGQSIICALHGAQYEPNHGRCVGGPCGRQSLHPVRVQEQGGRVRWYPDAAVTPAPTANPDSVAFTT
jgi:nitrite reductase/ring-hydroxylating ferredoxin subunit